MKHIYLPIPQSVSDSLAVSYAEDTLNPLQGLGLEIAQRVIEGGSPGDIGAQAFRYVKRNGQSRW